MNSDCGLRNLNRIAQTNLATLAHPDTVAYLLKRMAVGAVEWLRSSLVRGLLRKRSLERFRLFGAYYLIAIDGTGYLCFRKSHCSKCLTKKLSNGVRLYYHPVLEAKLICSNGLVISIATEFIENTDGHEKQDCELKALYRMLPKLRRDFPQLPICLLLDGLYLNQNVLDLTERLRLRYIITFKEGSLPEAYGEFEALSRLAPEQRIERTEGRTHRLYRWMNDLEHAGHAFAAAECVERGPDGETTRFLWATDYRVDGFNVEELSEKGGRCRWKIENEGFNTQKNGGYELEHAYCEDWNAARNFYILMQIAHLISQLIEKGNLFRAPVAKLFGSLRAFAGRLLEAWRTVTFDEDALLEILARRIQIRLDSS